VAKYHFGVVGLGVRGRTWPGTWSGTVFSVVGYDADGKKVDDFARVMAGKNGVPARSGGGVSGPRSNLPAGVDHGPRREGGRCRHQ